MKGAKGVQARRLALETLIQVESQGAFTANALAAAFSRKELTERDRAFVTALVMGVNRQKSNLDELIAEFSTQRLGKLPVALLNNLRLAVFQLIEMPDIPPSAVLNTSTELAKLLGHVGQARFVNGLLRNFVRTKLPSLSQTRSSQPINTDDDGLSLRQTAIAEPPSIDSSNMTAETLSKAHSMPIWIVKRWVAHFGVDETIKLLKAAQTNSKLVLRTCLTAISVESLTAFLEARQFSVRPGSLVPSCLLIEPAKGRPQSIDGYANGLFSIQDEASAFIALALDPKAGETIVDLCAGAGGKTAHISELMAGSGQVIAVDKNSKRLHFLRQNCDRLGLTNVHVRQGDSRTLSLDKQADRVLLDAPCMGTGVIGRRPDLRYHRREADLNQLVTLQRELLDQAAKLVKPGGVLVYSTCSLEPEENIGNMSWFLENHKEFKGADLSSFVPEQTLKEWTAGEERAPLRAKTKQTAASGFVQFLPSRHGVSGFFVARMVKEQ